MSKASIDSKKILSSFPKEKQRHQKVVAFLACEKNALFNAFDDKQKRLEKETELLEQDYLNEQRKLQNTYENAKAFVESEFVDLQNHNQKRHKIIHGRFEKAEDKENETYQKTLDALENLRSRAKDNYDDLIHKINRRIDESMQIHKDFIDEEEQNRKEKLETYSNMNADQANKLVWAIESSRNILDNLKTQLDDERKHKLSDFNQTVMNTLDTLRETKRAIYKRFKQLVDSFQTIQTDIKRESKKRQQPHTAYNQARIREYSQQIKTVKNRTRSFEKDLRSSWTAAKQKIKHEMLQAREAEDKKRLEQSILKHDIMETKAKSLLDNNKEITNLHVHKLQNEIKKIKMDSFKRAEEIKLNYQSPIDFLQNSINLLSNFHFYLGENFDAVDNLLSDFIQYHNTYLNKRNDYITTTAKDIEEYKNQFLVNINETISALTDKLKHMDSLSKELITIESSTRIKIADVKKQMENKHVRGDYEKTKAKLNQYRDFIEMQHDYNLKTINLKRAYQDAFLFIENSALDIHKSNATLDVYEKHTKKLTNHEHDIQHDVYELQKRMLMAKLTHRERVADLQRKWLLENTDFKHTKDTYLLTQAHKIIKQTNRDNLEAFKKKMKAYRHTHATVRTNNENELNAVKTMLIEDEDIQSFVSTVKHKRDDMQQLLIDDLVINIRPIHQDIIHKNKEINLSIDIIASMMEKNNNVLKRHLLDIHASTVRKFNPNLLTEFSRDFLHRQNVIVKRIDKLDSFIADSDMKSVRKLLSDYERRVIVLVSTCKNKLQGSSKPKSFKNLATKYIDKTIKTTNRHKHQLTLLLNSFIKRTIRKDVIHISNQIAFIEKKSKKIDDILLALVENIADEKQMRERTLKKIKKAYANITRRIDKRLSQTDHILKDTSLTTAKRNKKITHATKALIKETKKKRRKQIDAIMHAHDNARASLARTKKRVQGYIRRLNKLLKRKRDNEHDYVVDFVRSKKSANATKIKSLEQRTHDIENDKDAYYVNREKDLTVIHDKNKHHLNQTFRQIENTKYLSRPAFLKKINVIKEHLSTARDNLQQNLIDAQTDFLESHRQSNEHDDADMRAFNDKLQTQADALINTMTDDNPFTRMIAMHDSLTDNIETMQHIMQQKTLDTKEKLQLNERKSSEKQSRFISK